MWESHRLLLDIRILTRSEVPPIIFYNVVVVDWEGGFSRSPWISARESLCITVTLLVGAGRLLIGGCEVAGGPMALAAHLKGSEPLRLCPLWWHASDDWPHPQPTGPSGDTHPWALGGLVLPW